MNVGPHESDFDFLRSGNGGGGHRSLSDRLLDRRSGLFWACIGIAAFVLFVLVVVALTRSCKCESGDDDDSGCSQLKSAETLADQDAPSAGGGGGAGSEGASCLYAIGGGAKARGDLPSPHLAASACTEAFDTYFADDNGQYWVDLDTAVENARDYFSNESRFPSADVGPWMVVVLDIDETSLSNVKVMRLTNWDRSPNPQLWGEWVANATAPAIGPTLRLYKFLRHRGFGVSFITGRRNGKRDATVKNLKAAGYGDQCGKNWTALKDGEECYLKLGMRESDIERNVTATEYKSAKREALLKEVTKKYTNHQGRLVGSIGDQFSDLLGNTTAEALFKMPNPVYYIL